MRFGWRLAALGVLFIAMFGVLFTRLWYVQVAAGEFYAVQAEDQAIDVQLTSAPRGMIVDRNGNVLARSRFDLGLLVDRRQIPVEDEPEVIQVLAAFTDIAPADVASRFEVEGSGARFVLTTVDQETAFRILERRASLPGISIEEVPVRVYELGEAGTLMAHVIGHVGLPSPEDVEANPGIDRRAPVGKNGIELQYDEALRGTQGFFVYENFDGNLVETRAEAARPGSTVVLTIDSELQRLAEKALGEGIDLARGITETENEERLSVGEDPRPLPERGAVVVLDPNDFAVLAMASHPAFAPQDWVGGITNERLEELRAARALNNLAIQAQVPPASTFKAVTYVTAMETNVFARSASANTPSGDIVCSGRLVADFTDGSQLGWNDWRPSGHGTQDIHAAFGDSCNIYFWEVALNIWDQHKTTDQENLIQDFAREFGFGAPTGVDLPFEASGRVPDRELFEQWARDGDPRLDPSRIVPGQSVWYGGDLLLLAVGQGAMVATPLQLATSYGAMVNGGTVGVPYVVKEIQDIDGTVISKSVPQTAGQVGLSEETVSFLQADLARVANDGTAEFAFADFGPGREQVGGKTGSAQIGAGRNSHAWFVGVAPVRSPRYVVVVFIEEGGSGGRVAAPVAKVILQHLMGVPVTEVSEGGTDTD
ncbi:MAG: penicillin-binding transpeptidase domain-containing protein [Acidimicrobiia bacterium]